MIRRRLRSGPLAVVLVLGLGPGLAACTSQPPAAPPATSSTPPPPTTPIVVNALRLPDRFDPTDSTDRDTTRIASLLFRGLSRFDAKGKPQLEVAESIETRDSRIYTVTVSDGWTFSNGEPVTSSSFVDAWSRAADPAHPRLRRDLFAPISGFVPSGSTAASATGPRPDGRSPQLSGLRVTSPTTFTITLSRPMPDFPERLAHPAFSPLPDLAFTSPDRFATAPVGNGPYVLEGAWNAAGPIRLRPNAGYTATDPARNAGIDVRPYRDPSRALQDVRDGRLDVLDVLPTDALAHYKTEFGARAVDQPVGQTVDLVFPHAGPWTGSAGIHRRRALSMALDREGLATDLYAGTRTAASGLATPVVEGHSPDACGPACTHDPQEAQSEATAGGGLPPVTIAYAADLADADLARGVCADVTAALHVPCSVRPHPSEDDLREAVASGAETGPYLSRHQMDVALLSSFLVPRFVGGSLTNDTGYSEPTVDADLLRAATTPDRADRVLRYQRAEQSILETLPVVPLLNLDATAVSSTDVQGVRFDVFGTPLYTTITRPSAP